MERVGHVQRPVRRPRGSPAVVTMASTALLAPETTTLRGAFTEAIETLA